MEKNFFDFSALNIHGKDINMSEYKGKTILVVNTASQCGFTPQFEGLEKLYKEHKDNGLVILGFPCNQFGKQEPGDELSIVNGCMLNYGVSFPMFAKIDVNGYNAHPIYKWLKHNLGGILGSNIKWNFTKFLISQDGMPVKRYAPTTKPEDLEKDIKGFLP